MKRKQSRQSGRFYLFDYQGITPPHWFRGEVIKLLFSAISILFFSSCNNEVLPYSDDTSSSPSEVKIGKLIPNSTWAMPEVYYSVGSLALNLANMEMSVVFTADSAHFWRVEEVYDDQSHQFKPENTLLESHEYSISDDDITIGDCVFATKAVDTTTILLMSNIANIRLRAIKTK